MPNISIVDLHKNFYRDFREKYPNIPANVVITAENYVLSAYRSIKSNKCVIKYPAKKENLCMKLSKNSFKYKNEIVSLITAIKRKRTKCKLKLYDKLQLMLSSYKLCSDSTLRYKNNKFFIDLVFKIPLSSIKLDSNNKSCGVDLGIRIRAATSEGNLYYDREFNSSIRKLRYLKRQLQSKTKSKTAKKHLKKLKNKEKNKNRNFLHHLANSILKTTCDHIVLEDLTNIKEKRNKYQNKNRISQIGFYQLKQILTYKALLKEKTVIIVDPKYTSQTDYKTGIINKESRKGRRYYSGSSLIYDSDVNASINIGKRSKHPVSYSDNRVIYGQAIVNSPIVDCNKSINLSKNK